MTTESDGADGAPKKKCPIAHAAREAEKARLDALSAPERERIARLENDSKPGHAEWLERQKQGLP